MTPMLYGLREQEATWPEFKPPALRPEFIPHLEKLLPLASQFWKRIIKDKRISAPFRKAAAANHAKIQNYKSFILPQRAP